MKSSKLLTIAIPTFNRADTLNLLLDTLVLELHGLEGQVDVIIGDNASPDRTSEITAAFKDIWPNTVVLRHDQNLGPDENFCKCVDRVSTQYFWIIGDDDLPKKGVIRKIVELLERENPDLVYVHSEWNEVVANAVQGIPVKHINYRHMSQLDFARRVNVWFTFISGMVINRDTFTNTNNVQAIRRFAGSNLVQLGWVLGLLKEGRRFIYIESPCILAKAANSGGYAPLTVFGENFINIVLAVFGVNSVVARIIILRNMFCFLPKLIWTARFRANGNFNSKTAWTNMKRTFLGQRYLLLPLAPIILAPIFVALPFLLFTLGIAKLLVIVDKIRNLTNILLFSNK